LSEVKSSFTNYSLSFNLENRVGLIHSSNTSMPGLYLSCTRDSP